MSVVASLDRHTLTTRFAWINYFDAFYDFSKLTTLSLLKIEKLIINGYYSKP
jgi:hypothetical protein